MSAVWYDLHPTDPTADRIYGRALDKEAAMRLAREAAGEHGAVQVWQRGGGGPASCVATVRAGGER